MRNAIKTEYCGEVFDSKSEAVFARALHLAGFSWCYHPDVLCDHEWDFLVIPERNKCASMLIEYKPSMPTMTYINNLINTMMERPVKSIVVWGNPWDGPRRDVECFGDCSYTVYPIFSTFAKYGWGDFCPIADHSSHQPTSNRHPIEWILNITEPMIQEAKRYRFDLVHGR